MDSLGNAEETYGVIKVHELFIKPDEQTKAMVDTNSQRNEIASHNQPPNQQEHPFTPEIQCKYSI